MNQWDYKIDQLMPGPFPFPNSRKGPWIEVDTPLLSLTSQNRKNNDFQIFNKMFNLKNRKNIKNNKDLQQN